MSSTRYYQDNTTNGTSSTTGQKVSNSLSIHTEPGVYIPTAAELEEIRQKYEAVLGRLNVIKAKAIEDAFACGVEASAVLDAIDQTAMAPRPSPYYLAAILRRYGNDGIHTAEEAAADRFRRRSEIIGRRHEQMLSWYGGTVDDLPW